jgi:colicin import membrane protein
MQFASARRRHAMTTTTTSADPFRFGWRYVRPADSNGTEDNRVPLTPEDVLHPQEGDQIPENTAQQRDREYLSVVLKLKVGDRPGFRVLADCLVNWGVPGLKNHSPDLAVFEHVADPLRDWGTFPVVQEGARPVLVMEIVSPQDAEIRDNDVVKKVREYYRAGVPLYVIVDQEEEEGPRHLLAYRRGKRGFVRQPLDSQGRVLLGPVGLQLGLRDDKAICFDAVTGEEIPDFTGMVKARDTEARGRQQAEQSAAAEVQARQQAEQARQQAEQTAAAEAQARQQAEAALAEAQAQIRQLEAQARPGRRPRGRKP